jgi:hypothetical protein
MTQQSAKLPTLSHLEFCKKMTEGSVVGNFQKKMAGKERKTNKYRRPSEWQTASN